MNNLKKLDLWYCDPKSTWERTLDTHDKDWKRLRETVIEKNNWTCNFCAKKLVKDLVVSHFNGDTANNSLTNLVLTCPLCYSVRSCGTAYHMKKITLAKSKLTQLEIVQKSHEFFLKHGKKPSVLEIDGEAIIVEKLKPFQIVDLKKANPNDKKFDDYKVFFTSLMNFKFLEPYREKTDSVENNENLKEEILQDDEK